MRKARPALGECPESPDGPKGRDYAEDLYVVGGATTFGGLDFPRAHLGAAPMPQGQLHKEHVSSQQEPDAMHIHVDMAPAAPTDGGLLLAGKAADAEIPSSPAMHGQRGKCAHGKGTLYRWWRLTARHAKVWMLLIKWCWSCMATVMYGHCPAFVLRTAIHAIPCKSSCMHACRILGVS